MWGWWLRGMGVVLCCDHWGVIFNRIKSLPCKSRILIREHVVRAQSKQDSHTVLWQLPLPRYYTLYIPKFSFGACLERDAEKAAQAFSCVVTYTHCPLRSVGFFSAWASAPHARVHGTLWPLSACAVSWECTSHWSSPLMIYTQRQSQCWVNSQKWLFSSLFSALEEFSPSRTEVSFLSKRKHSLPTYDSRLNSFSCYGLAVFPVHELVLFARQLVRDPVQSRFSVTLSGLPCSCHLSPYCPHAANSSWQSKEE